MSSGCLDFCLEAHSEQNSEKVSQSRELGNLLAGRSTADLREAPTAGICRDKYGRDGALTLKQLLKPARALWCWGAVV